MDIKISIIFKCSQTITMPKEKKNPQKCKSIKIIQIVVSNQNGIKLETEKVDFQTLGT